MTKSARLWRVWPPYRYLDTLLDGFGWEDRWDNFTGPRAKAHHLLKGLDLGGAGSALRRAGQIIFQEFGGSQAIPTLRLNCAMI
jgi:hypothetical protein